MSIRLRLTLLYSAILVLTLVAFGVSLYVVQSQVTLSFEEDALIRGAQRFAQLRQSQLEGEMPLPPSTSPDRYLQTRSPDGKEVDQIMGSSDVILPLSDEGLQAVQNGEVWTESVSVEGERLLIHSVPIMVEGDVTEILQMGRSLTVRDQSVAALGRSLLIGCIVTTVAAFGLGWVLAGVVLCIMAWRAPATAPVRGPSVSEADRDTLVSMGVLKQGEPIELFYAAGMWSVREGGTVITSERLAAYGGESDVQECRLADIRAIEYIEAEHYFDEGFFSYDRLENAAHQLGLPTVDHFLTQQRRELLAETMRGLIMGSVQLSRDELMAAFNHENTMASLDFVKYRTAEYRRALNLTDAQIEAYIAGHEEEVKAKYDADESGFARRNMSSFWRRIGSKSVDTLFSTSLLA